MKQYIVSEEELWKVFQQNVEWNDFFKSKQPAELVAKLNRTDYLTDDETFQLIQDILDKSGKCQNIKIYIQKEINK